MWGPRASLIGLVQIAWRYYSAPCSMGIGIPTVSVISPQTASARTVVSVRGVYINVVEETHTVTGLCRGARESNCKYPIRGHEDGRSVGGRHDGDGATCRYIEDGALSALEADRTDTTVRADAVWGEITETVRIPIPVEHGAE